MNGLVGGPLLAGGLGPPAPPPLNAVLLSTREQGPLTRAVDKDLTQAACGGGGVIG